MNGEEPNCHTNEVTRLTACRFHSEACAREAGTHVLISPIASHVQMALTSFLAKVCPLMEEQLDETVDNRLFDGNDHQFHTFAQGREGER